VLTYLLRRLLVMIPTLLGITAVVFVIINLAPGSPIEQKLQAIRFAGGSGSGIGGRGESGVSDAVVKAMQKQYGFDKPLPVRYGIWLKNLAQFDFGNSLSTKSPW